MLTNTEVAKIIADCGYGKLPSGCHFKVLDKDFRKEVIIAPNRPMPNIFYIESDDKHELIAFKAM